jgi:hypothetical protein
MFGFCLRAAGTAITLAIVLSAIMIAFGSTQSINPAARGFIEGCEGANNLCWYGVVYREANPRLAQEALLSAGYSFMGQTTDFIQGREYENYNRVADEGCNRLNLVYSTQTERPELLFLNLEDCHGIYIADLFELFGAPQFVSNLSNGGFLSFANNIQAAFGGRLRSYAPVLSIRVNDSPANAGAFPWQGFATYWYYCQLETAVDFCKL